MGINISEANQFIGLHAHPQEVNSNDLSLINGWISKYPYCQTLHILATTAFKQDPKNEDYLAKAATFTSNREVLFQFINNIENFETDAIVLDESANVADELTEVIEPRKDMGQAFGANLNYYKVDEATAEDDVEEIAVTEVETLTEEPTQETENVEEPIAEENIEEIAVAEVEAQTEEPIQETENVEEPVDEENIDETAVAEIETLTEEPIQETENIEEPVAEKNIEEVAVAEIETLTEEPVQQTENIEEPFAEESIEEIAVTEVETLTEEPTKETENVEETVAEENIKEIAVAEIETLTEEPTQKTENVEKPVAEENIEEIAVTEVETLTEKPTQGTESIEENNVIKEDELVFESPVASDFFAFAKAETQPPLTSTPKPEEQKLEQTPQAKTKEDVSQYNDETLPYTFLWWLNKTRKEHATNTQPYIKGTKPAPIKKRNQADEGLNHQIAENIFHLRGVDDIASTKPENQTVPFDFRKKEFSIINKFIKEEPQIKPPAANKIDSENKAKKSSEDANQVVSETLAKIYVEQMLYHKALDVYKKLSLKYPEKSTYFASQIKYLELKVN